MRRSFVRATRNVGARSGPAGKTTNGAGGTLTAAVFVGAQQETPKALLLSTPDLTSVFGELVGAGGGGGTVSVLASASTATAGTGDTSAASTTASISATAGTSTATPGPLDNSCDILMANKSSASSSKGSASPISVSSGMVYTSFVIGLKVAVAWAASAATVSRAAPKEVDNRPTLESTSGLEKGAFPCCAEAKSMTFSTISAMAILVSSFGAYRPVSMLSMLLSHSERMRSLAMLGGGGTCSCAQDVAALVCVGTSFSLLCSDTVGALVKAGEAGVEEGPFVSETCALCAARYLQMPAQASFITALCAVCAKYCVTKRTYAHSCSLDRALCVAAA
mmetsp:Transcript_37125/g.64103  ORF Transcript_37125/g.64103 Transcript_37125/m.64103 type:complete len:336 (-) Transcript_37125:85-1092(-)